MLVTQKTTNSINYSFNSCFLANPEEPLVIYSLRNVPKERIQLFCFHFSPLLFAVGSVSITIVTENRKQRLHDS